MKRLLYVATVRLPTEKAHGLQIVKTCEALAANGVHVTLLVPSRRSHIADDVFEYYGAIKNFTLSVLKTPDWIRFGALGYAFSSIWFSESTRFQKSFLEADVVYSRDALVLIQYLLLGKRLMYEAHTKPTWISTIVAKHVYHTVVISEGLRDAYLCRGVRSDRMTVVHDAIDPIPFGIHYDQAASRVWLGLPTDKKIVLYVGRIDAGKGAKTFAEASEFVSDDTLCVLIGSGPLLDTLKRAYQKAVFIPETPYRLLPRVLSAADVLVLPNSVLDENAAMYTSPLKAFAYLAAKKPIIASDVPALRAVLSDSAYYIPPDVPAALGKALDSDVAYLHPHQDKIHTWKDRAEAITSLL